MNVSNNALNVLTAKTYKGIGKAWVVKNMRGNESVETLVVLLIAIAKEPVSINDFVHRKQQIQKQLEGCAQSVDGVVAIGDENFPQYRGVVKSSEQPIALFYRGNIRLIEKTNNTIAVIGLLNPDEDTIEFEKKVVSTLVDQGVTIVSGLALGCDAVAHRQALHAGGHTVAILPSPITDILPQANRDLAAQIVQNNGLLISEYLDKAYSKMELSGRYIERDRLQALFSNGVVLTASYAENDVGHDSGSRHAMAYALNYGIPRAVMYDAQRHQQNPTYDLNRQLIQADKNITIINSRNMAETITQIAATQIAATAPLDSWVQRGLF
jgi:DNA processing protein